MKVKYHKNEGLTAPQKFLLQLAAAIVFTVLLRYTGYLTPDLYIPFFNVSFQLPWAVYMVFAAFVIVGYRQRGEPDRRRGRPGHRRHPACGAVLPGGLPHVEGHRPEHFLPLPWWAVCAPF